LLVILSTVKMNVY